MLQISPNNKINKDNLLNGQNRPLSKLPVI